MGKVTSMRFDHYSFGSLTIDGQTYDHDVIVDAGAIRKRKKGPSKALKDRFGHTPLSVNEDIPWSAGRLVIGTGANGSLPVMDEIEREAARRKVDLVVLPTTKAIDFLNDSTDDTNAILHVTC